MKNRASSHLIVLLLIMILTAIAHYAIYYGALIRGYETSYLTAGRNIGLIFVLTILPFIFTRLTKFKGNWTLYTSAVLMFSIGLTIQYRLFSDEEYISKEHKFEARQAKTRTLQEHFIQENYSAEKKQFMGMPATPPSPIDLSKEKPRPSKVGLTDVLFSEFTLIPLFAISLFFIAYYVCITEKWLKLLQSNGFLLVLLTLVPLMLAAVTSRSGKSIGNMTPWEPSKIPFLVGFAAVLSHLYKNLSQTYWGIPRAKDLVPLIFMAIMPFIPFFVLKDFGQMMVFSSVYVTLYLIAIRRLPQRVLFVGTVVLLLSIIILSALPASVQIKVPLLSTLSEPVKTILPPRIHQRFHLWFDALNPPKPDTPFWKNDLADFYGRQYKGDLIDRKPDAKNLYDDLAKTQEQSAKLSKDDPQKKTLDSHATEVRREITKIAAQDIAEMYAQTKDESPATEQPPATDIDDDDATIKLASQKELKELKEKLDSMNEEAWFGDDALQASRATFGISSGGKTGRGLGLGYVELIPVADSDYVYAAIGEELGLFGGLLITFALITLISAGVRTALDSRDMFSKLCSAGLTAFLGFQALVNIGGITRALPMTGITLPFVSHGGFSLITSFAMLGMLMAFSHRSAVDANLDNALSNNN